MKKVLCGLFATLSLLALGTVYAEEETVHAKWWKNLCGADENPLMLNVWGMSHHPYSKYKFNERNWGLGLRCNHKMSFFGERWSSEVNMVKNSVRGKTLFGGSGAEYKIAEMGGLSLYLGGALSAMAYEHPLKHKTLYGILAVPTAAIELPNKMALRAFIIPSSGEHKVTAYVFYMSIPFDAFFNTK